jgi:hypothetical protein
MDAVVAFIANGEATKPVEPGERALYDPAEHAKAAAVGRAATAKDRNNAAGGEAITMWLRIVATVALQDVGPSARPPAASANGGQVRDQGVEVGDVVDVRRVTCATSGTPRASVTMWCLDPALRRSVGFGPVFFPRASRGPTRCPPPSSAGRAVPVGAARRGGSHASDARRRPFPTPPSVASTCCLSRIPFQAVTSATATAAQHKQDAGERRALGDPRPSGAAPRTATGLRKQRLRRAHSESSKRGYAMRDRTESTAQVQEISQRF